MNTNDLKKQQRLLEKRLQASFERERKLKTEINSAKESEKTLQEQLAKHTDSRTACDKMFAGLFFYTPTGFRLAWVRENGQLGVLRDINRKVVANVVGMNNEGITVIMERLTHKDTDTIAFDKMSFDF